MNCTKNRTAIVNYHTLTLSSAACALCFRSSTSASCAESSFTRLLRKTKCCQFPHQTYQTMAKLFCSLDESSSFFNPRTAMNLDNQIFVNHSPVQKLHTHPTLTTNSFKSTHTPTLACTYNHTTHTKVKNITCSELQVLAFFLPVLWHSAPASSNSDLPLAFGPLFAAMTLLWPVKAQTWPHRKKELMIVYMQMVDKKL